MSFVLSQKFGPSTSIIMPQEKPFRQDSEAYKKMVAQLEDGTIDPMDKPKSVWLSDPMFQEYDLKNFRAGLNKYKMNNKMMVRKAEDSKYLECLSSARGLL